MREMRQPLKVLYMLHDSRRSGVPAVMAAEVRALDRSRVTPCVLFAYDGPYAEVLRAEGVDVRVFGKRRPFLWRMNRFLFNLRLLWLSRVFDLVHVHSTKLACSVLFAKLLRMRAIYHLHELPGNVASGVRKAMAAADCVVFCSHTCAEHFKSIPAGGKRTIVNAMAFDSTPPAVHHGRGRKVVMVGSINQRKGQHFLLEAFSRLRDRDAELWLYGTTGLSAHKYVHDLKAYAAKEGFADRVFFPGPTGDVFSVFREAAVVVHTSLTESFGMALVEAMSCGIPVVAHDLEGMREVVQDGVTGFLVQPGDVQALAARIEELLADPALRSRMGSAAWRAMRERYDIVRRIDEYHELYEEVCRR
ncbi:glycosyltransferase family 4 protein [Geomonas sp. RF6]|uniref:glycosyltransferase family 4 protein n=1 Tax=Geomonas sp. RF6 TaxID=2897342 RepID=UPI001E40114E|nr:glycosyltransferase family 4 protein [Geomonas sp. RF6]UFS72707.1 glycosyltransferase family 4 protein [Geomonas sp. RF6]